MRLGILEHGHRRSAKLFIRLVRRLGGQSIDPVAQMALYRPRFFCKPVLSLAGDVLRGPSYWTPAEREYLAVFSSNLNECQFCVRIHAEVASIESHGEVDMRNPGSVRPQLQAVLPLLELVNRSPQRVTRADVQAVRDASVPDEAIVDALHVNLIFNCMNRLANAFDFGWDSDEHVRLGAKVIHRVRYRLPRPLMR
jgi:AhpD family alkylhydroperoxidase